MNAFESAEAQKLYFAMDNKQRQALVEELAVRHALSRSFGAEYAEVGDDGDSVRIVWIDGLCPALDDEFDTSFSQLFCDGGTAWKAAAASLRENIRAQTPDDLWKGVDCYGFVVRASKGVTMRSLVEHLRYVHTITDHDEKDGKMLEFLQSINIFRLGDHVCLGELPYYDGARKKEVITLMNQVKHGRKIKQPPAAFYRYWCFRR